MFATTTDSTTTDTTYQHWLDDFDDEIESAKDYYNLANTFSDASSERVFLMAMAEDECSHAEALQDVMKAQGITLPQDRINSLNEVKSMCSSFR